MALRLHGTRRQFAGSVAAVVGAGLSGCTSETHGLAEPQSEVTPISKDCERKHQELPDLVIENEDSQRHTVELTITGERGEGSNEAFFEDTFDLRGGQKVVRGVAFDPDAGEIDRFDGLQATVSTEDGRNDTEGVHATVIGLPLRYSLEVRIGSDGAVHAEQMHVDTGMNWEPAC